MATHDVTDLQKELKLANKTIEKLKVIAIELKVSQKKNERITELIQADYVTDPASTLAAIRQLLLDGNAAGPAPLPPSRGVPTSGKGTQTEGLIQTSDVKIDHESFSEPSSLRPSKTLRSFQVSKREVHVEIEPSAATNAVMAKTPSRGLFDTRSLTGVPSPSDISSGSNKLVEKWKLEAARFKEEALGARDNLRLFAEVKDLELEELRHTLEDTQRRLTIVQKKSCDDDDSIAFLEGELNVKKAALERVELINRDLQTQNEVLLQFQAAVEKRAAHKETMRFVRQNTEHLYVEPPVPTPRTATKIIKICSEESLSLPVDSSPLFPDTSRIMDSGGTKNNSVTTHSDDRDLSDQEGIQRADTSPGFAPRSSPVIIDLTSESPTDKTTLHSDTRTSSGQSVSAVLVERESELRRLESEKQQTISMLRAKDLMIEKLHRRLKSMATNETLDGAISRMATRESKLERELSKLKHKVEVLEGERDELKHKMTGELINTRDWSYLRSMLPKFLQHFQKGETEMARALLPVVCSILRLSNDECVAILKCLSIPAPRSNL